MRLLADTHILLWALTDSPDLKAKHRQLLTDSRNTVFYSAISIAEIAVKESIGKLTVPGGIAQHLSEAGFEELPFTGTHATQLRELPLHHRDPFDRMLIAQAITEQLVLLSVDEHFRLYSVDLA
jgi:PIN domain nuclease of toxin-antitoxin system